MEASIDGCFKIEEKKDGIYLIVYPPIGQGQKVAVADVVSYLNECGIVDIDFDLVEEIVKEAEGVPQKIAEKVKVLKPQLIVEISEDETKAWITVIPSAGASKVNVEDIKESLLKEGVVYGVDEEKIKEVVEKKIFSKRVPVAFAKLPKKGKDAEIIWKIKEEKKDEEGRIDYREMQKAISVRAGQIIAEKIPAEKGEDGVSVKGNIIPAQSGEDIKLVAGKNTKVSDDGLFLISKIDGVLLRKENRVDVEPVFFVKGDLDFEVGNINFLGRVEIGGNVREGFKIEAHTLYVGGYVEAAYIKCKSDVVIEQGIMGKGKAKIETEGNVKARFIENTKVCARNVFVKEAILHSEINASERVILAGGKRGIIIGGRIRAGIEVNCKRLGSVAEIETIVEVGIDPKVLEELSDLQKELRADEGRMQEIVKHIKTAEQEGKKETIKQLEAAKEMLMDKMRTINLRISKLKSLIQSSKTGKICVCEKVYPGVMLCIGDVKFAVQKEYRYVTFRVVEGALKTSSYEEPPSLHQ